MSFVLRVTIKNYELRIMLRVIMLSAIMLSVIMLKIVVPRINVLKSTVSGGKMI